MNKQQFLSITAASLIAAGALAVTQMGTMNAMPTRAEVDRLLAEASDRGA